MLMFVITIIIIHPYMRAKTNTGCAIICTIYLCWHAWMDHNLYRLTNGNISKMTHYFVMKFFTKITWPISAETESVQPIRTSNFVGGQCQWCKVTKYFYLVTLLKQNFFTFYFYSSRILSDLSNSIQVDFCCYFLLQ